MRRRCFLSEQPADNGQGQAHFILSVLLTLHCVGGIIQFASRRAHTLRFCSADASADNVIARSLYNSGARIYGTARS